MSYVRTSSQWSWGGPLTQCDQRSYRRRNRNTDRHQGDCCVRCDKGRGGGTLPQTTGRHEGHLAPRPGRGHRAGWLHSLRRWPCHTGASDAPPQGCETARSVAGPPTVHLVPAAPAHECPCQATSAGSFMPTPASGYQSPVWACPAHAAETCRCWGDTRSAGWLPLPWGR